MDWELYQSGNPVLSVSIAKLQGNKIVTDPSSYEQLLELVEVFCNRTPISHSDPDEIAKWMAGKTHLIKIAIMSSLNMENSELERQYDSFKRYLIENIKKEDFADIYAQTITYGLFTARLHFDEKGTFDRTKAASLIPKSNPFLRKLFSFVEADLPDEILWIIEDVLSVLEVSKVDKIIRSFSNSGKLNEAFVYFYEKFISIYDPKKRKKLGVYYTPIEIVNYIIRSIDEVLKTEFNLVDGLASDAKIETDDGGQQVHRVQILDPATGTGTFLAEIISLICEQKSKNSRAVLQNYVEKNLLPRIHGFEIMMAPYAMCHLKLEMTLDEHGFKSTEKSSRFSVYLSNALEQSEKQIEDLDFANWLSDEAKGANSIKTDKPIMCVLGNPPYSVKVSTPKGWIGSLMSDYFIEPNTNPPEKLKNEKNPKNVNDLYAQFIRFATELIDQNGEGIMGFITNHGFIDNTTFRGMRYHLLKKFDKIWILDLNGNVNRKEVSSRIDQNVFEIRQGVSIIIAMKAKSKNSELAELRFKELIGSREEKNKKLSNYDSVSLEKFELVKPQPSYYYFKPWVIDSNYEDNFFSITEFMPQHTIGMVSGCDEFAFANKFETLKDRLVDSERLNEKALIDKYDIKSNYLENINRDIIKVLDFDNIIKVNYRPFDYRFTYYSGQSGGVIQRPRNILKTNFVNRKQIGLVFTKQSRDKNYAHAFVSEIPIESSLLSGASSTGAYVAPLHIYDDGVLFDVENLVPKGYNFEDSIKQKIIQRASDKKSGNPDEMSIFDYLYGVLNCLNYRHAYERQLKSNFPRIPYPRTPDEFWDISQKGKKLRLLHLMKIELNENQYFPLEGIGDNVVMFAKFDDEKMYFNTTQFLSGVPLSVTKFQIGGYYPAIKWLSERKGTKLEYDDIQHYRRILLTLLETEKIVNTLSVTID